MEPGADNGVSRQSAIGGRTGEGAGIEPPVGGSIFEAQRGALNSVGAGPESVVIPCVAALRNIEGATASHGGDPAEGPAAEDKSLGPFPGFREGNFPNIAHHQPVTLIIDT